MMNFRSFPDKIWLVIFPMEVERLHVQDDFHMSSNKPEGKAGTLIIYNNFANFAINYSHITHYMCNTMLHVYYYLFIKCTLQG